MPALKLGIALAGLRLPLKRALPVLAEWKVNSVELDARTEFRPKELGLSAIRELRKVLQDYSLKVGLMAYHTRRGYATQDDLEARVEGTKAAMKLAAALGCAAVSNHIGLVPDDAESAEWKLLTEVLADLGKYGQHVGATLCAQTGPQPAASFAKLLAVLPLGSLGIDLCPGPLLVYGHEPTEYANQLGTHIRHVHANDAVQGFGLSRGRIVALGEGAADWPALLGALQERDYRGDFTLEATGTDDPREELESGIRYLRGL